MNKHRELIKAWVDGAKIQVKNPHDGFWSDAPYPSWDEGYEYRIKSEDKWKKVREHWEKGGSIQYRYRLQEIDGWKDFNCGKLHRPNWDQFEWRIKPIPKIEYTFSDEVKESIEGLLDCFDFQRVLEVMNALNWSWWFTDGVPEIWDVRKEARQRLKEAVKGLINSGKKRYYSSCGGFLAEAETEEGNPKIYLKLSFVVSEWDNWDN